MRRFNFTRHPRVAGDQADALTHGNPQHGVMIAGQEIVISHPLRLPQCSRAYWRLRSNWQIESGWQLRPRLQD
jgi:hypothetical protein